MGEGGERRIGKGECKRGREERRGKLLFTYMYNSTTRLR